MDDTSQIQPPESFANLFRSRAGVLKTPIAEVVARYELCEDLACHLVEQAQTLYHSGNSSEEGILLGFHAALSAEGGPVTPAPALGRAAGVAYTTVARIAGPSIKQPPALAPSTLHAL